MTAWWNHYYPMVLLIALVWLWAWVARKTRPPRPPKP